MKLTLQIQLLPDVATGQKLKATVARFNEAANYLASKAYERTLANGSTTSSTKQSLEADA